MEKNEKGKPHILLQFLPDYAEALCLKMKTTIHLSPETPNIFNSENFNIKFISFSQYWKKHRYLNLIFIIEDK